jgi:hypothetical protein
MFWLYWDTTLSIVFGAIMFGTFVTRRDAKFVEVRSQSRAYPPTRNL